MIQNISEFLLDIKKCCDKGHKPYYHNIFLNFYLPLYSRTLANIVNASALVMGFSGLNVLSL